MDLDAKIAADTLRKMANVKQMLAFPHDTGKIINACADLIESLAAELEQVTQERDAAVEDVAKLKRCEHCIGYEEFLKIDGNIERCNDCEERSNWQWRGVRED